MNPIHFQVARQCEFLKDLTIEESQAFLNAGREVKAVTGSFLLHQDDPATLFYILLQGTVRLTQLTPEGHQVIIHHVRPGQGIGIIVVLSHQPYPVSAEIIDDVVLRAWDGDTAQQFMRQIPQLAINGIALVAHRFVMLQDQYRELATERVERRVAHAILRLVRQVGKKVNAGILLDLPLSRQDLAEMTGTTLYTTSRILSQWEKAGWIETGRQKVILIKPHALVTIAEDLPNLPPPENSIS
jgi:CRP-like cAMP-binding protein